MRAGMQDTDCTVGVALLIISFMVFSNLNKFQKNKHHASGCFPDGLKKMSAASPAGNVH
jgi:hypothetical protein